VKYSFPWKYSQTIPFSLKIPARKFPADNATWKILLGPLSSENRPYSLILIVFQLMPDISLRGKCPENPPRRIFLLGKIPTPTEKSFENSNATENFPQNIQNKGILAHSPV